MGLVERGNSAASLSSRSLASVSADGHPGALAGERADHDADLVGGGGELARSGRPARTRRSCPAAPGTSQPASASAGHAPGRARRPARRPARAARPRAPATRWPRPGRRRRRRTAATPRAARAAIGAGATAYPTRKPGQPVGLGEGAGEHDVLVARGRSRGRRPASSIRTNSTYASSTTTSTCGGHLREERVELGLGDRRAGGVVGRADQHDPGAVGDRRGHRVEVVAAVGAAPAPAPTSRPRR